MKKLVIAALLLASAFSTRAQSVSAKDLIHLLNNQDKIGFLKAKSFKLLLSDINEKGVSESFAKGNGAARESIFTTSKTVSYMTRNKTYIDNLLNQLKKQCQQTSTDNGKDFDYYQFDAGNHLHASINIPHSAGDYYSLEVIEQ